MVVKLVTQKPLQGAPQGARPQVPPVIRGEHDLSLLAARPDLVRAPAQRNAVLNPDMLVHHLEPQQMGRFHYQNALHQFAAPVSAQYVRSHRGLISFGAHRIW
jgi:hypothetical protein